MEQRANPRFLDWTRYHPTTPASAAPVTLAVDDQAARARVHVPQLEGKPLAADGLCDGWLPFHRDAYAQLQALFAAIEAEGLLDRVLSVGDACGNSPLCPLARSNAAWRSVGA